MKRVTLLLTVLLLVLGTDKGFPYGKTVNKELFLNGIAETSDCCWNGIELYGRVQFVESFPDIKIQVVESFPDLKVKLVESFPDECGEWEVVESFPDFKVQVVESFADLKVQYVESFPGMNH
jgi:hypothetical protein